MSSRTIQSPGIEIRENDISLRAENPVGTNVYLTGFAAKGPTDEVFNITTVSEFTDIFGLPTNDAERYAYHSAKKVINSFGTLWFSRLPYGEGSGEGFGNNYSALVYPVQSLTAAAGSKIVGGNINFTAPAAGKLSYTTLTDVSNVVIRAELSETLGVDDLRVAVDINTYSNGTVNNAALTYDAVPLTGSVNSKPFPANTYALVLADGTEALTASGHLVVITEAGYILGTDGTLYFSLDNTAVQLDVVNGVPTQLNAGGLITTQRVSNVGERFRTFNQLASAATMSASTDYILGSPVHVTLNAANYESLQKGTLFNWSDTPATGFAALEAAIDSTGLSALSGAGAILVNKAQTTINTKYEGFYMGITDSFEINVASDFKAITSIRSFANDPNAAGGIATVSYDTINQSRLAFNLTATANQNLDSISEIMENLSSFDVSGNAYGDSISAGIFKLRQSVTAGDVINLDFTLSEGAVGSFDYHRQIGNDAGGPAESFFLEKRFKQSQNVDVFINPFISNKNSNSWLNGAGVPTKRVHVAAPNKMLPKLPLLGNADSLFPLGVYSEPNSKSAKSVGNIPAKLIRSLGNVANADLFDIDVTIEAGLGTINAITETTGFIPDTANPATYTGPVLDTAVSGTSQQAKGQDFYDELVLTSAAQSDIASLRSSSGTLETPPALLDNYRTIFNIFNDFAAEQRRDHLFVADAIRHLLIQGTDFKVIDEKSSSFPQHIYWPLRHQFERANTSHAAVMPTWEKVNDEATDENVWVPFSGSVARAIANTSATAAPWEAPAGPTRGLVQDALDIAYYPTQKQSDQLYKINLNPVQVNAREGIRIFGQKTLLRKPSAFDRINVRMLFLFAEKASKSVARFYVFEPNNVYTRTQVVNNLNPVFERIKTQGGIYEYRVICNKNNNPALVIDNNELAVDIYIAPTRTAEFVLLNFHATRSDFNFAEIEGGGN